MEGMIPDATRAVTGVSLARPDRPLYSERTHLLLAPSRNVQDLNIREARKQSKSPYIGDCIEYY